MTFLEERDFSDVPTIPEYFKGKTFFITGGSGFLGKLIIEKLLYSCPDLDRIYIFLRSKKGVSPEDRLSALYSNSAFERLRNEKPGLFESKVFVISGNIEKKDLGMSEKDREMVIKTTNIIIHSAASIRFDDSLKTSLNINLMGTLRMIDLAKEMQNLECYSHISTSFCNKHRDVIEEKLYTPLADWREMLEICNNMDPHTLEILTPKLLGEMPNTYVFMKHLAEHVVDEQRGKLPIIILRPSIVTGSVSEPSAGWVDNFNGPVGLITAGGQGILRVIYAKSCAKWDYVPADVSVKSILTATWARGTTELQETDDVSIYNVCCGEKYNMSLKKLINMGKEVAPDVALEYTLRPAHISFYDTKFMFNINVLLFHLLPAIAIDILFRIFGKKPMLVKLHRRIYVANAALEYFMTRKWQFNIDNFMKLRSKIKPQDREQFYYSCKGINKLEYILACGLHTRKYLMHQKEETLPKWRLYYRRAALVYSMMTFMFYGSLLWWFLTSVLFRTSF